ncbi:hypothetical protein PTSG_11805 [Salpingoeca rosetta]|uniref:Uncharacterized protein n=1 Tax=Salpingoeca rosetta (strain ATCC 50818 / BSB-021) TaxID=946362 RepID=F2TZD2_SALR5|nr:uncharacterized protein PTSG_11805 [Salpingoeca rosetta]EGD78956.1 hypothetical protein PTSG_11805 [Salpingoeca rosetta]|eukprot:XP_004997912.1 hypothetical protein PTSG_11805 [Salpingoeca rosetta]
MADAATVLVVGEEDGELVLDDALRQLQHLLFTQGVGRTEPFSFTEVASRCRGRLDIRVNTEDGPFATLARLPVLNTLPQAVLGSDMKLNYTGVVVSLPGSEDQNWHVDGDHLFPHVHLPPHAVTVFIPLENVDKDMGLPQRDPVQHIIQAPTTRDYA